MYFAFGLNDDVFFLDCCVMFFINFFVFFLIVGV